MNAFVQSTVSKKSDQLNADDLVGGEKIIKVTRFSFDLAKEQPLSVHYEGEGGKPFKPCLTMRKAILGAWGDQYESFGGRFMALYRDATVLWAGEQVGGIRVKAMTHMKERFHAKLIGASRKKIPVTIEMMEEPKNAFLSPAEIESALSEAKEAAGNGTASYRGHWASISNEKKAALKSHHEQLKAAAAQADETLEAAYEDHQNQQETEESHAESM